MKATITQEEFDNSGMEIIEGTPLGSRGRNTYEYFKTSYGQSEFKTMRGLKRALTINDYTHSEANAVVITYPAYWHNWVTGEKIQTGYSAQIVLVKDEPQGLAPVVNGKAFDEGHVAEPHRFWLAGQE